MRRSRRSFCSTALMFVTACPGKGSDEDSKLHFEVAAIRPYAGPPVQSRQMAQMQRKIPSANDPLRFASPGYLRFRMIDLRTLVAMAFDLSEFEIRGPAWLDETYFSIEARTRPETTSTEARMMLRNLLRERFGLAAHDETSLKSTYALVAGRHGPKLTPAAAAVEGPAQQRNDVNEITERLRQRMAQNASTGHGGVVRIPRANLAKIADVVSHWLGITVVDQTGITGDFEVNLWLVDQDFEAVSLGLRELGLELKPVKAEVRTLVVDEILRTPIPD